MNNQFSLALDASWEPDLWGSVSRTVAAQTAGQQGAAADLANARLSAQATLRRQDLPQPGGMVLMCPGIDLGYEEEMELPTEPQPALSITQLRSFAAAYLGEASPHDEVVDALRADLTGYPPLLIQAGTGDVLGKDAHRLAERATACGVEVQFELYPVTTHDFHVFWSFLPEAADALEQAGAFVRGVHARSVGRSVGER